MASTGFPEPRLFLREDLLVVVEVVGTERDILD